MVDYEHQNFSISQAVFHPNAQSHIVSLASQSTTTDSPAPNPTSTTGPVIKTTTGSGSHGIGTGAIAGIAIAIVLIASLVGTFFIFKSLRRRNSKKVNKGAIEVDASDLKDMPDIDEDSKKDFPADLEVKKPVTATVTVYEAVGPMTPPSEVDGGYFFTGNETGQVQTRTVELPGSPPNRSELSTPEPWTPELPSPDPEAIRSELSTPDPCYNHAELPSPDPSQGLDSPGISSISSGQPSPPLYDNRSSALHSPTHLPLHRPTSDRIDSSESEAGFTRDGMLNRPFHRRYQSDDSLSPSLPSRPLSSRMDSSDSDTFIHPHPMDESSESEPIVSPIIRRMPLRHFDSSDSEAAIPSSSPPSRPRRTILRTDSSSESEAPSRQIRGLTTPFHSSSSSRPAMVRSNPTDARQSSQHSDSSDSDEWQTRYNSASTESPSELSRFPSLRNQRGVANGGAEARDGVLVEESSEREEGDR